MGALGNTEKAFDLHDVMFQNATHNVDGQIQWESLHAGISIYGMVGAVMVAFALFMIMNASGLKAGKAALISSLALVAGGLTAGGFISYIHAVAGSETATSSMWLSNPLIICGIIALASSLIVAIIYTYKACNVINKFQKPQ